MISVELCSTSSRLVVLNWLEELKAKPPPK